MKANSTDIINNQQSLLLVTLRRILKPFVRLLLAQGITYTILLEELKRIFVQVADEEFYIDGKRQTDSRITLITGVHRKDVHRIRTESNADIVPKANFGAQLIGQWVGNPRFLDVDGQPLILSRYQTEDAKESFDSLVTSVSKDFRAKSVYDEWLRSGIISLLKDNRIQLNTEAFIPTQDLEEQLYFLGMNIHDHLAATVHNVSQEQDKMMERCVYYDQLSIEQIHQLHDLVKNQGMKLLKSINQSALELKQDNQQLQDDQIIKVDQPKYRMNTGVYFYYELLSKKENSRLD